MSEIAKMCLLKVTYILCILFCLPESPCFFSSYHFTLLLPPHLSFFSSIFSRLPITFFHHHSPFFLFLSGPLQCRWPHQRAWRWLRPPPPVWGYTGALRLVPPSTWRSTQPSLMENQMTLRRWDRDTTWYSSSLLLALLHFQLHNGTWPHWWKLL